MKRSSMIAWVSGAAALVSIAGLDPFPASVNAQEQNAAQTNAAGVEQAPEPLSAEEMDILVARIALYPDELVAAILAASIYPIQIVQAQRFLDQSKSKKDLQPGKDWDGSVISLLNYPEIVGMMNDDLDWTEALGEAVANQQKDVLQAIQQLRDKAVAQGVLRTDEKTKVVQENEKIIIQPASAEKIYVPVYEPEMLYVPNYVPAPITYYPDPYPSYYYPTAPYFAGFVTGVVWGAIVDWDDWGVWGGRWGNDIDIDCNHCFNNNDFSGNINWNKVDWNNVDRNKISIDKSQFNKIDRNNLRKDLKANGNNSLRAKTSDIKRNRPAAGLGKTDRGPTDVRNSALKELKGKPGSKAGSKTGKLAQGPAKKLDKPGKATGSNKPKTSKQVNRPAGKPKPGGRPDARPKKPSPMGDIARGRDAREFSNRGGRSMGGGYNRGGGGGGKVRRRGRR
jgi:hypothetical protein